VLHPFSDPISKKVKYLYFIVDKTTLFLSFYQVIIEFNYEEFIIDQTKVLVTLIAQRKIKKEEAEKTVRGRRISSK